MAEIGCNWARIGPSKSSQSLSIAHKWAVLGRSLEEKWPLSQQKWFILPKETKGTFVRHGPECPKKPEIGAAQEKHEGIWGYTTLIPKKILSPLKTPKEILAMESVSFLEPPPLIETPEKQNLNKLCDYHEDRGPWKELQWRQREEKMSRIREQAILRARSNFERRPGLGLVTLEKTQRKEDIKEVFTINHERPNQYVTMGAMLTTNCKQLLADILWENMEDMYPFLEKGEELASLMGYSYKCFLRLSKEYNQIRMAVDDEEKNGFHTEEGVYCFTHMPKELKNSAATL
ncbi:hypothetical protein Tco_1155999 [Tanacetum coccineum]